MSLKFCRMWYEYCFNLSKHPYLIKATRKYAAYNNCKKKKKTLICHYLPLCMNKDNEFSANNFKINYKDKLQ